MNQSDRSGTKQKVSSTNHSIAQKTVVAIIPYSGVIAPIHSFFQLARRFTHSGTATYSNLHTAFK